MVPISYFMDGTSAQNSFNIFKQMALVGVSLYGFRTLNFKYCFPIPPI